MNSTVLTEIIAFLLGRKYYANVIITRGVAGHELCSYIFRTKQEAEEHRQQLDTTLSFRFVETISFRSRKEYIKPNKVKPAL